MEFISRQLQDGINLWVWPTDKFKNISIKISLHRHLGGKYTANGLLPFILNRGTQKWPTTRDIAIAMADLYGTQYALDVMKIGEQQLITTELEVVNPRYVSDNRILEAAMEAAVQLLFYPRMDHGLLASEYVEQEKEMMRKRIASLINNKRSYARQRFFEVMFQSEAFARYKYGSQNELDHLNAETMTSHFNQVISSSPVNVFVVGDVEPDQVADGLASLLPKREGPPESLPDTVVKDDVEDVKVVTETEEISQAVLYLGYRTGITARDPLYYPVLVANGILGGFPHSKLFLNVREKASLAYYASSSLDTAKGALFATAGISPENYERAVGIIEEQVTSLQDGDISGAEMDATKKGLANWLRSVNDSPISAIDRTLGGLVKGSLQTVDEAVAGITEVTKDQVVAAAQRFKLDTVYCLTSKGAPQNEGVADERGR